MKTIVLASLSAMALILAGCMNMPTPTSQITPAYVSGVAYRNYDLQQLKIELDHLVQREQQLIFAQEQRRKTSETQAFWWGFGQGDGIEASELAKVRGEISAVKKAIAEREQAAN